MKPTAADIAAMKGYCVSVGEAIECGSTFYRLKSLRLPASCTPAECDALFCPTQVHGYPSRLYFAQKILTPYPRNWNFDGGQILGDQWWAFSFNINKQPMPTSFFDLFMAHYAGMVQST